MPKIARDHLYKPRIKVGAIICNNGWLGDFFVSFACGASNVINKDVHFRTGTDGSEFTYTVDNRLVYYTLHMSKYCTNEKVFLDVNYVCLNSSERFLFKCSQKKACKYNWFVRVFCCLMVTSRCDVMKKLE